MKCPGFERLLDYLDGDLAAADAARMAAHLASDCAACAANRQWYQQVRTLAATDETTEPPAWVTKRALRIFETQRPRLVERIQEAIAALVFDSLARPQMAGVRSTETANRQLLYQAGDFHIDLQIAPVGESHADLVGQVLREGETTFESVAHLPVSVLLGGKTVYEATTNEMGEFVIKGVGQGDYDLRVETNEGSVTAYGVPVTQAV